MARRSFKWIMAYNKARVRYGIKRSTSIANLTIVRRPKQARQMRF